MSALPGLEPPADTSDQTPKVTRQVTERGMLDALHYRYSQASQGDSIRYACAEHVRSSASFNARRICDFIAQDLWLSGKLALHGHEVKVSRGDWLRELADPSKAEEFMRYCDRWWLVVPDREIVRNDLPERWGLMTLDAAGRLRVARSAPKLDPEPHPATFRAALLRATAKTNARRGGVISAAQREADRWRDLYNKRAGR